MKIIKYILLILLAIFIQCKSLKKDTVSNTKIITGFVYESPYRKLPIVAANVKIKGSQTIKAITDFDGKFELQVKENDILIIEYVNYGSKKVKITKQDTYEIFFIVY